MAHTLMAAVAAIISYLIARYALPIDNGLMASQRELTFS
jgi:phage gp36-like protein